MVEQHFCKAQVEGQYRMVAVNCEQCGKPFKTPISNRKRGWGKYCSRSCAGKARKARNHNQCGPANPNWKGGISSNHYHYKKLQKMRYPERMRARKITTNAIARGKLIQQPCVVCGIPDSHAHHEDYSRPLEVIWLCAQHHRELHQDKGTANQ